MIDLHLHLLPAVDDGPPTLDVSEAMVVAASSLGFDRLVATPHLEGPLRPEFVQRVRTALADVQRIGAQHGVQVSAGWEIQLSPDVPARLERGEALTLAGSSTVLVELPFSGWPLHADRTLFEIQTVGFRVLLAHPERYVVVQQSVEKAIELVDRGVLLQVTFGSLTGLFGKPAQRVAEELLRRDAVTVLASDAHSAGSRFLSVAEGRARAIELAGAARVDQETALRNCLRGRGYALIR